MLSLPKYLLKEVKKSNSLNIEKKPSKLEGFFECGGL